MASFSSDPSLISQITECDADEASLKWEELVIAILSPSMYCEGLAGFGCEVPLVNKLLKEYLHNYFEEFPFYIQDSIHRLVNLIKRHDLHMNESGNTPATEDVVDSAPHGEMRRAVALCHYMLGLRMYFNGEGAQEYLATNVTRLTKTIQWSIIRKIVEDDILSLPQSYLRETKIKTIAGCILCSTTILTVMDLSSMFEHCLLYDWYENDEDMETLCPTADDGPQIDGSELKCNRAVAEILSTITMDEFSRSTFEYWIDTCENETRIDSDGDKRKCSPVNKELLKSLWEKCHLLTVNCRP